MNDFEKYLQDFADRELAISLERLNIPEIREKEYAGIDASRAKIMIESGINLNWDSDFISNPASRWIKMIVNVDDIAFTGSNPYWNEILLDKCKRSPVIFKELIAAEPDMREKFYKESSFSDEPVMLRKGNEEFKYRTFDGIHRLVGHLVLGKETIEAWYCENEEEFLPYCSPSTVYDLIRGFQRNARNEEGKEDLFHSLKLLANTYGNVKELLEKRFNKNYVNDEMVQEVIQNIIKDN